jgi:anaerobic C4-dicarboxylate transporter DcuA
VAFVFVIGLPTGMPPRTVLGMIAAVVTASATMQAAGGLNYLAALADRSLRVWPGGITIIAPIVAYIAIAFVVSRSVLDWLFLPS